MNQIMQFILQYPLVQGGIVLAVVVAMLALVGYCMHRWWSERQGQAQVASQPIGQGQAQAASTEVSGRMGWNMRIAKTHELATQVIGVQIAGANLLAIAVSAASIVGGMVVLASQQYPGNYLLWFAAGAVGLGLAILIEGITISSLIRIRNAGPAIRKAMEQWEAEFETAKQADTDRYYSDKAYRRAMQREYADKKKRLVKPHEKKRSASIPFAFLGAVASATAGGLFYHNILQGLETWVAFAISGLLAVVVTGTFVSQELFREDQEDAIKEGFKGGSLTLAAIKEETKRLSMQEIYNSLSTYLQSDEARNAIKGKLLLMLNKSLDEITDNAVAQLQSTPQQENAAVESVQSESTEVDTEESTEVSTLKADVDEIIDTICEQESVQSSAHIYNTGELNKVYTPVDTLLSTDGVTDTDPELYTPVRNRRITKELPHLTTEMSTQESTKTPRRMSTRSAAKTDNAKAQKAMRIIKRNPEIGPTELSKKAEISYSYATKLLAGKTA